MRIEAPSQFALTLVAGKAAFTTAPCSLRERLQRAAAAQRPRPDSTASIDQPMNTMFYRTVRVPIIRPLPSRYVVLPFESVVDVP